MENSGNMTSLKSLQRWGWVSLLTVIKESGRAGHCTLEIISEHNLVKGTTLLSWVEVA